MVSINMFFELNLFQFYKNKDLFRSVEYADILQEANCIVVTSGQVLVDGQAVKACKIDLSCNTE